MYLLTSAMTLAAILFAIASVSLYFMGESSASLACSAMVVALLAFRRTL